MTKVVCDASGEPARILRDQNGAAQPLDLGADVIDLDAHRPHAVGYVVCRACHHWHVGVIDMRADFQHLQCSGCNQMTAESRSEPPPPPAQVIPFPIRE